MLGDVILCCESWFLIFVFVFFKIVIWVLRFVIFFWEVLVIVWYFLMILCCLVSWVLSDWMFLNSFLIKVCWVLFVVWNILVVWFVLVFWCEVNYLNRFVMVVLKKVYDVLLNNSLVIFFVVIIVSLFIVCKIVVWNGLLYFFGMCRYLDG